jgi:hypothetical protein
LKSHYKYIADIPLVEYKLLQKYISGKTLLIYFYRKIKAGDTFYNILIESEDEFLTRLLKKKYLTRKEKGESLQNMENNRLKRLQKSIPRPNVKFEEVTPMGNTKKKWESIYDGINNILGKGMILNIYSDIGEEALVGGSVIVEKLSQYSEKINIISGFQLNNMMVDFDTDITSLFNNKEILVIFSVNSVQATDFRKDKLQSIYDYAKTLKIPVILTNKSKLEIEGLSIINIKLKDELKNESQLFDEVFGK